MRKEITLRVNLLVWAAVAVGMAAFCTALLVLAVVAFPLVIVWAGIPLLFVVIVTLRPIAHLHRRHAGRLVGRELASPYLRAGHGNLLLRVRSLVLEPATRRDLAWLAVNGTVGLALCIAGLVEAVLDLLFWWLPPGQLMRVHAFIAVGLLAPNESTTMAQRVQQLTESRAETVDTSAAELRRIERDLHDGAQARLVALGMSLGMAEEQLARDPDNARALLAEARESSSVALAELRDLVRGIHPPVLADRGLVGAVRALCLAAPIPIEVTDELSRRLPAPVESAAYFAVAEAVTNVIKHSGATRAEVHVGCDNGVLRLRVCDDGCGGADASRGTGLRGIGRRLSAFDGTLRLTSPVGGPTSLELTLPFAG